MSADDSSQAPRSGALYVVGAGGLGRETLDTALAAEIRVTAFLDHHLAGEVVRGLPVLAPDSVTIGEYVIGIADPAIRRLLSSILDGQGLTARTLIHPRALIAPEVTIAAGCLVLARAYVSSSVVLGRHSQVQYNATVGHDTVLGERVTIYPGANISGAVRLEDDVSVGSNAVVLQGRKVGSGAFVGAGAVVTRDVPSDTVVVGNPARPLRSGSRDER